MARERRAPVAYEDLTPRQRRRQVIGMLVRNVLSVVVVIVAYYLLPFDHPDGTGIVLLAVGLAIFGAVLAIQIRGILTSSFPRVRAIGALGVGVPLLLAVFAAVYYLVEDAHHGSFTQTLDKTGGLYFAITVFATVGFGDISPVSGLARILVSLQMLLDLVVFGVIAKVILGAVQISLHRRESGNTAEEPLAVEDPLGPAL